MSEEIVVGSLVQVPPGGSRPRTIVMQVIKVDGSDAWVRRLGSRQKPERVALKDFKLEQSKPMRVEF